MRMSEARPRHHFHERRRDRDARHARAELRRRQRRDRQARHRVADERARQIAQAEQREPIEDGAAERLRVELIGALRPSMRDSPKPLTSGTSTMASALSRQSASASSCHDRARAGPAVQQHDQLRRARHRRRADGTQAIGARVQGPAEVGVAGLGAKLRAGVAGQERARLEIAQAKVGAADRRRRLVDATRAAGPRVTARAAPLGREPHRRRHVGQRRRLAARHGVVHGAPARARVARAWRRATDRRAAPRPAAAWRARRRRRRRRCRRRGSRRACARTNIDRRRARPLRRAPARAP